MHETFEDKVNAAMNAAREKAGKTALESLRFSNNVVQMSLAGSKGSNLNISQMVACCAQQNVEGKRIPFGFTARTLPHFNKDNYGPESRCVSLSPPRLRRRIPEPAVVHFCTIVHSDYSPGIPLHRCWRRE